MANRKNSSSGVASKVSLIFAAISCVSLFLFIVLKFINIGFSQLSDLGNLLGFFNIVPGYLSTMLLIGIVLGIFAIAMELGTSVEKRSKTTLLLASIGVLPPIVFFILWLIANTLLSSVFGNMSGAL